MDDTTPSRLKRLSLVPSKPVSIRRGGDSIDSTSSVGTNGSSSSATGLQPIPLSSSPLSPLGKRRPRSSISYASPSNSKRLPPASTPEASSSTALSPPMSRTNSTSPAPELTLAERHADLLRTIAMRERRVNELKQELASQEAALAHLRQRWTSIARTEHVLPTAPPPINLSRTTSPSPSPAPPPVPEEEELSLNNLWTAITTDADETIQEGKRFWGQLVKTVSAAAAGSVPDKPLSGPKGSGFASGLGAGLGLGLGVGGGTGGSVGGGQAKGKDRRGSSSSAGSKRSPRLSPSVGPVQRSSPSMKASPKLPGKKVERASDWDVGGQKEMAKGDQEKSPAPSTVVLESMVL